MKGRKKGKREVDGCVSRLLRVIFCLGEKKEKKRESALREKDA